MNENFNIVISSKNTGVNDTNSSLHVKLEENLSILGDNEIYICMQSFHMIKSFYSCQAGLNDHFQIIVRPVVSPSDEAIDNYYLPQGNYDVKSLMNEIIKITRGEDDIFQMKYEPKLNKYIFTNLFRQDFNVYIKCINSGIFFGFENGKEYLISSQGTYSSKFINVSGYSNMIIRMQGDFNIGSTFSNIYKKIYEYDKILGILNISDVAPMDGIVFEDNGSCMFKYRVNNNQVANFSIEIVNEEGTLFPQMADWIMVLKCERIKPKKDYAQMEKLLTDITYYMAQFYAYMKIPSRITLKDFV